MIDKLEFDDSERLFSSIGYDYSLSKFQKIYNHILVEHAIDLFTPKSLLEDAVVKLSQKASLIHYSLDDLKQHCDKQNKDFDVAITNKKLSKDFSLYILYCDPINDISKLNWKYSKQIYLDFKKTPYCPAKRFFASNINIIVLNNRVIDSTDLKQMELQLDHELNHLFSSISKNAPKISINNKAINICIQYLLENNIISRSELESYDFNIHMFNDEEFYEMLSNLCNVLSLYFNEKDNNVVLKRFMEMTSENFIKSNEFKKLEEPIRGALIFAFICKKYAPERWNRVMKAVVVQLNLNKTNNSIKKFLNDLKYNFSKFLAKMKRRFVKWKEH